jgi:hypothetical protein
VGMVLIVTRWCARQGGIKGALLFSDGWRTYPSPETDSYEGQSYQREEWREEERGRSARGEGRDRSGYRRNEGTRGGFREESRQDSNRSRTWQGTR